MYLFIKSSLHIQLNTARNLPFVLTISDMKPEETSTIKTAGATFVVSAVVASIIGNPVCWAAVLYGTYRMGKAAYKHAQANAKLKAQHEKEDTYFWHV